MLVGEALDELRGSILRDVSSLTAGAADTLWTDAQLCRYINEAQVRFARKTLVLRDKTTAGVATIPLVAGVSEYLLHASILATLSVRYDQDVADLPRASHNTLDTRQPTDAPWFDVNANGGMAPGRPRAYSLDQAFRTLRVYPVPTAAEDGKLLTMRVARLPLLTITDLTLFDALEIPEEYQVEMLEWAAYKALSNHDADAHLRQTEQDAYQVAANAHKTNFENAVAEAIRDAKRNMFSPVVFDFANTPGVAYQRL